MWLRFRHQIKYSYDFGNTLPIDNDDINSIIINEPVKILDRLIGELDITMFNSLLREEYIRTIETLYAKTAKENVKLVDVLKDVHNRIQVFRQSMPLIFISDDKPKRVYGLYSYNDIKKEIERLLSIFEDNYGVKKIIEEVLHILKKEYEIRRVEMPELEDNENESWFEETVALLEKAANLAETPDEECETKGLLEKIKNMEMHSRTLGKYIPQDNLIVLYIYNIQDSISQMTVSSSKEALLNAVTIVLNHEMFHAFHYFCLGDNKDEREKNWSYNTRPRLLQDSVIEGLATAWEYESRPAMFGKLDVYDGWREKREKEFNRHDYPAWPYSAAKELLFDKSGTDKNFRIKLAALFYLSIINNKYRWRISYIALSKYLSNTSRLTINKKDLSARIARRNIRDEGGIIVDNKSEKIQKSVFKRHRAEE